MTSRPWLWLRVRVEGLMSRPDTRLARHFMSDLSEGVSSDGARPW